MTEESLHTELPKKPSSISFQFKAAKPSQHGVSVPKSVVSSSTANIHQVSTSAARPSAHLQSKQLSLSKSKILSSPAVFDQTFEHEGEERPVGPHSVQAIRVIEGSFIPQHEEKKEKPKFVIPMSLEDQEAAHLLIEDAGGQLDEGHTSRKRIIPAFMMRNRVFRDSTRPDTEEGRFKYDLQRRPNPVSLDSRVRRGTPIEAIFVCVTPRQASLEDYEKMPVEEFGAALLRGMGYVDDQPDRGTDSSTQRGSKEPVRRPVRLGLGAQPRPDLDPKKPKT